MTDTIHQKYKPLKASKSNKKLSSKDIFAPQHLESPSMSTLNSTQPKPYSTFISELISSFNSLSTPSTGSTSSPTLHTFFQGADHEAHIDERQKKKVVKALQLADPAKVNEVISILKSMPDPTLDNTADNTAPKPAYFSTEVNTTELKPSYPTTTEVKTSPSNHQKNTLRKKEKREKQELLDKELQDWDKIGKKKLWETQKSNDQLTGTVEPEPAKGLLPSNWWFSVNETPPPLPTNSISSNKEGRTKSSSNSTKFGSSWLTTRTKSGGDISASKRSLSTGEQIAIAAASLLVVAAIAKPKLSKAKSSVDDNKAIIPPKLRHQSSMPIIKSTKLTELISTAKTSTSKRHLEKSQTEVFQSSPSFLGTITSITRQFLTLDGLSSIYMISACTFWWGYEIYVPHKCMDAIERVSDTSQAFFDFLSGAIVAIPGMSMLSPIAKLISTWVGYQWSVIKADDHGKGVVISAVWILPVALASRPWDHSGNDKNPVPEIPTPPLRTKKSLKLLGLGQ